MPSENYLKPEVIARIKRLDLRAKFIVNGFLHGLHSSPFQGFSVEFSEHRRYAPGDDPKDIDWRVYAKTDKFYVRKFESETNLTGYLIVDQSASMNYTFRQDVTKFDYAVCLAAALAYLMIRQRDPVGLLTFGENICKSIKPGTRPSQLARILSVLSGLTPNGKTDIAKALHQVAAMLRRQSLVMIISDLLADEEPVLQALRRLKFAGHDAIIIHLLDEAEVEFPFDGALELQEPETGETIAIDSAGFRDEYRRQIRDFRKRFADECAKMGADYLPMDTSMPFDTALTEYLLKRRGV